MMLNNKKRPLKLLETVFDIAYLSTVLIAGIWLCLSGNMGSDRWLFGLMALVLGIGDSFHLLPRIWAMWGQRSRSYTALLGRGKLIASVTMTIFYVILWEVGIRHYPQLLPTYSTTAVYALAALRIILCLFPQNRWTEQKQPLSWIIMRNIPFLALGMLVMALFAAGVAVSGTFAYLWLAILCSFICYLPVVLWSGRYPALGMLMLPKSCAYAAMILIGFSLSGI